MIRLVLFLLGVIAIAAGFHWLADRPGSLVLDWQGYVIETSVFRAVILFAILFGAVNIAWALTRQLWRTPAAIGKHVTRKRERRGLDAISSGMIAIGSGDRSLATRAAIQARKSLPNEPLTHLLRAQAAQLQGDSATARRIFEAMLASPDTEQLGLRGLFLEAQREKEVVAASQFAERALKLNPKLEWPSAALFDLQCKTKDWAGALDTVASAKRHGHVDKKVADRRRAVLLTAQAQAMEDSHADKAAELALEAHNLAPELVPAAAIAGRVLASRGQTPKAAKVLQRTWKSVQHPELAAIYAHARPGDSVSDRLERVRQLAKMTPHSAEGPIALATAAVEARDWELARKSLEQLVDSEPSQRICTLMARIEGEGFNDTGKVREWLARAVHAPRDPAWTADGIVADQWAPTSPVTGTLDAFEWRVPVEALDKPDAALLTARTDELIKLGRGGEKRIAEAPGKPEADDEPQTIEVVPPPKPAEARPPSVAAKPKQDDIEEVVAEPVTERPKPAEAPRPTATVTPLQPVVTPAAVRKPLDANAFITPSQHAPDDPGPRTPVDETDAKSKLERYRLIGAKN